MDLREMWMWLDALEYLMRHTADTLDARAFYARWFAELADEMAPDMQDEPGDLRAYLIAQNS